MLTLLRRKIFSTMNTLLLLLAFAGWAFFHFSLTSPFETSKTDAVNKIHLYQPADSLLESTIELSTEISRLSPSKIFSFLAVYFFYFTMHFHPKSFSLEKLSNSGLFRSNLSQIKIYFLPNSPPSLI